MDDTVVAIAGDGDDSDRRRPLLSPTEEIHPYTDPPSPQHPPLDAAAAQPEEQRKPERVVSLDVFRGFTVAMMILVDDAGGAWPGINHAPWFGVTVADFVMPAFLFIIGVSAALVFKKMPNKTAATKKGAIRASKLFILGVILQGGYIHGRHKLTYGVDLDHIRWLGVLQVVREHDPTGRDVELFSRHFYSRGNGPAVKGSKGAELADGFVIKDGEYKLVKGRFSSFATNLDSILKTSGIKNLVVTGVQTPNCIRLSSMLSHWTMRKLRLLLMLQLLLI